MALGVPTEIAKDDRGFWLLVHEDWDGQLGGWTSDRLSDSEARALLDLLDEILPDRLGWDLATNLSKRANTPS